MFKRNNSEQPKQNKHDIGSLMKGEADKQEQEALQDLARLQMAVKELGEIPTKPLRAKKRWPF